MTGAVRIGLVGCRAARRGRLPARLRSAARDVVLAAVAEPDPLRRGRLAALAGGRALPSPTPPRCSTARTSTPSSSPSPASAHLDDAAAPPRRGLPVLVEKPPAPDAAGAAALAALDPAPFVAFNRRFDPGVRGAARSHAGRGGGAARSRRSPTARRVEPPRRRRRRAARPRPAPGRPRPLDHRRRGRRRAPGGGRRPSGAAFDLELGAARARIRCADGPAAPRARRGPATATGSRVARHRVGGPVAAVLGRLRPGPIRWSPRSPRELEAFAAHGARRAGSRARPGRRRRRRDGRPRRRRSATPAPTP